VKAGKIERLTAGRIDDASGNTGLFLSGGAVDQKSG
jgi:hypothetical protein